MRTSAFFMIGAHPEETYEDIEKTRQLIAEIQPDFIIPAIAVPYPGTEPRKQMSERNLIFGNDWSKYAFYGTLPVWRTVNFSPGELLRTQQDLVRNFYMKPSYIIKRLLRIQESGRTKILAESLYRSQKSHLQKIREAVNLLRRNTERGIPCGSESFVERLERVLNRFLRYRPQGRPRK
jgi:radical SAM superfamily enzyme YgiQ (UPF0313 family)